MGRPFADEEPESVVSKPVGCGPGLSAKTVSRCSSEGPRRMTVVR
jgi:hypothetical protein